MKPTLTVNRLLLLISKFKQGTYLLSADLKVIGDGVGLSLQENVHLLRLQQRRTACMHVDLSASMMERAIQMLDREGSNGADLALKNDSGYYKPQKALFNYF